jgi:hypothetical protein
MLENLKIFEISEKFIPSNITSLLTSVKTISLILLDYKNLMKLCSVKSDELFQP